eukprot:CAMPEP_0113518434 /NCGR_PEP_ID=MMETSP0014_2-20120614/42934_1 /TAXON_ID=2857 /ORGANISM="Nitzschia sp." /LENGTH=589 /DNA_ID=CAMNT_0000415985 /DNA_START=133 /DNA_END=1899 /DNA_ORIENTATION=+ /assembly_acc=CAM_ASM_000159
MTTAKVKKTLIDGRSSSISLSRTKTFILSVVGILVAGLTVGHDSPHTNTITVVSAERAVEWRLTTEPKVAIVELKEKQQHQQQQHQVFHDLSSEIVEIFDGYYDESDHQGQSQSREEDDADEYEEDDLYYFMRNGHRKTQESSSSTRVNIFQKLGESLGLTIVGCCLIILMPCLIWKNEGRHVRELTRIDFCKNKAVAIDCKSPTDETIGRLVQFTGDVTVGGTSLSFGTGGSLDFTKPLAGAILVRRVCYIWQKFEVAQRSVQKDAIGGGETRTVTYTMKEDWTPLGPQKDCLHLNETNSRGVWDQLVAGAGGSTEPFTGPADSPEMSPNPMARAQQGGNMPTELAVAMGLFDPNHLPHALQVSKTTRVGDFALSEKIITGNPQVFTSDYVPVPSENIPDLVPGCEFLMKSSDNVLRTYNETDGPSNGDIKVVYEYVNDGFPASFLVAQTSSPTPESEAKFGVDQMTVTENHCLGQCQDDLGQIWMVRKGSLTLFEMIDMAKQDENMTVKLIRVVGWVLLCIGWVMLFSPFLTALQVLPLLANLGYFAVVLVALIVSALCCCTVMILAYIRYRPLLAGGLMALALAIW